MPEDMLIPVIVKGRNFGKVKVSYKRQNSVLV